MVHAFDTGYMQVNWNAALIRITNPPAHTRFKAGHLDEHVCLSMSHVSLEISRESFCARNHCIYVHVPGCVCVRAAGRGPAHVRRTESL